MATHLFLYTFSGRQVSRTHLYDVLHCPIYNTTAVQWIIHDRIYHIVYIKVLCCSVVLFAEVSAHSCHTVWDIIATYELVQLAVSSTIETFLWNITDILFPTNCAYFSRLLSSKPYTLSLLLTFAYHKPSSSLMLLLCIHLISMHAYNNLVFICLFQCQVPVYESFDYFERVQTKESGWGSTLGNFHILLHFYFFFLYFIYHVHSLNYLYMNDVNVFIRV